MKDENKKMKVAKKQGVTYEPETFDNGDTLKQLLARSRCLPFEFLDKWAENQRFRSEVLFK